MKTFRMEAILAVILGLVAPVRMARAQSASGSGASTPRRPLRKLLRM
jgi:hypothetical protein